MLYNSFVFINDHPYICILSYKSNTPEMYYIAFVQNTYWTGFYSDVKEYTPPKMTEPLGILVKFSLFVDANHSGIVVIRIPHTSIFIEVQNAPVVWY